MTKPQPGKSSGGSGGSGGSSSSGKPMSLKSAYLVVYNALCATGWMAVAVTLVQKLYPSVLAGPSSPRDWDFDSAANAAMPLVFVLQLCATLEILHAAFGWVKGGVLATIMQVVGRDVCLFTAACEHAVRSSPWSSALFAAWALAEIIRYPFYVTSLLQCCPAALRNLRYSAFLVLYPLGFATEIACFVTAKNHGQLNVPDSLPDYVVAGYLVVAYALGSPFLFRYMLKARSKRLSDVPVKKAD